METSVQKLEELYSLKGLRIIVTGASGGLGLNQALMLAQCGATVFALSRTGHAKEDLPAELPDSLHFGVLDVRHEQDIAACMKQIGDEDGIDVLVNNAGITIKKRAEELTTEEWETVHQVNVTGVFNCCRYAFPYLKASRHIGRIINIASMASSLGFSQVVPYSSSKAAVLGITRGLAVEWSADNILVNAVSPGWFPSEMSRQVMDEDRKKRILNRMPLHRFGSPDELSPIICFLSSPAASYITGQEFAVDGGALAYGF